MSKNMTRKGLAFGAGFALVATGLAAMPAQAAVTGSVTLDPTQGSSYASILQSGFTLVSEKDDAGDPGIGGSDATTFIIENPGAAELKISYDDSFVAGNGFTAETTSNEFATADTARTNTDSTIFGSSSNQTEYTTDAKFIHIRNAGSDSATAVNIDTTVTDKDVAITVQALQDGDSDGFVDTFERVSPKRDIILYAPQNVGATTTFNNVAVTSQNVKATVVYGQDVNPYMVKDRTSVKLFKDGVELNVDGNTISDLLAVNIGSTSYPSATPGYTKNTLVAGVTVGDGTFDTTNNLSSNAEAGVYTAQAFYATGTSAALNSDEDKVRMGSPSRVEDLTVGASTKVDGMTPVVKAGPNQRFQRTTEPEVEVRSKATSVTFGAQLTDSDVVLKDSNVEVRARVSGVALDSDTEITVTGAVGTLVEDGAPITAYSRTDSNGRVSFTLTTNTGEKDDAVDVVMEYKNSSGEWVELNDETSDGDGVDNGLDIKWIDAVAGDIVLSAKPATYVSGDNPTVTFAVTDKWLQPISFVGDERLSVFASAFVGGVEDASVFSERETVVDGSASFSFENFATASATAELRAELYIGNNSSATKSESVIVYNTADTDEITVANSFETDITYTDFVVGSNKDADVLEALESTGLDADTTYAEITGNVLNEDGSGQPGVAVTLSADGVLFYDDAAGLYAEDSIVVAANEFGAFDVYVYAHTVAPKGMDVTIEADGATATTKLVTHFPEDLLTSKTLNIGWDFPEVLVMNTTYAVTATLSDKWGNPVQTDKNAVKFQGNGSVQVNGIDEETSKDFNRDGEVTVFVRSIKDIAGPGEVTATLQTTGEYLVNPDATGTDGEDGQDQFGSLTSQSTNDDSTAWDETAFDRELIEEVDVKETAPAASADQKVNAGSFKGYVALYAKGYEGQRMSAIVAGKWLQVDSLDSDYERIVRFTGAGYDIKVRIYIDGEQVGPEFDILTK